MDYTVTFQSSSFPTLTSRISAFHVASLQNKQILKSPEELLQDERVLTTMRNVEPVLWNLVRRIDQLKKNIDEIEAKLQKTTKFENSSVLQQRWRQLFNERSKLQETRDGQFVLVEQAMKEVFLAAGYVLLDPDENGPYGYGTKNYSLAIKNRIIIDMPDGKKNAYFAFMGAYTEYCKRFTGNHSHH